MRAYFLWSFFVCDRMWHTNIVNLNNFTVCLFFLSQTWCAYHLTHIHIHVYTYVYICIVYGYRNKFCNVQFFVAFVASLSKDDSINYHFEELASPVGSGPVFFLQIFISAYFRFFSHCYHHQQLYCATVLKLELLMGPHFFTDMNYCMAYKKRIVQKAVIVWNLFKSRVYLIFWQVRKKLMGLILTFKEIKVKQVNVIMKINFLKK